MEYCSGGDLSNYISRRGRVEALQYSPHPGAPAQYWPHPANVGLDPTVVRCFLRQLAKALKFLRDRNLMHRDIKPQNLLLQPWTLADAPTPVGIPLLKLADFGFARSLPSAVLADTPCGSPFVHYIFHHCAFAYAIPYNNGKLFEYRLYMAPEILRHDKYDAKADLWSVGAVLYTMSVGNPPFVAQNRLELLKQIDRARGRIVFPDEATYARRLRDRDGANNAAGKEVPRVPGDIKALVRMLLKKLPVERANFEEFFANDLVRMGLAVGAGANGNSQGDGSEKELLVPPAFLIRVPNEQAFRALDGDVHENCPTPPEPLARSSTVRHGLAVKEGELEKSCEEYVLVESQELERSWLTEDDNDFEERPPDPVQTTSARFLAMKAGAAARIVQLGKLMTDVKAEIPHYLKSPTATPGSQGEMKRARPTSPTSNGGPTTLGMTLCNSPTFSAGAFESPPNDMDDTFTAEGTTICDRSADPTHLSFQASQSVTGCRNPLRLGWRGKQKERDGMRSATQNAGLRMLEDIAQKAQVLKDLADQIFDRVEGTPSLVGDSFPLDPAEVSPFHTAEIEDLVLPKTSSDAVKTILHSLALYIAVMAFSQEGVNTLNSFCQEHDMSGSNENTNGDEYLSIDNAILWFRNMFKASAERSAILKSRLPGVHQGSPLCIDKVIYDHALSLMREAASKELLQGDWTEIESGYEKALWMLYAIADNVIQEGNPYSGQDVETISELIDSTKTRLGLLRSRMEAHQRNVSHSTSVLNDTIKESPEELESSELESPSRGPYSGIGYTTAGQVKLSLSDRDSDLVDLPPYPPAADGGYCELYIGFHRPSRVKLAMKRPKVSFPSEDMLRRFRREAKTWSMLDHKHILSFFGIMTIGGHMYLVSRWMPLGDLLTFVENRLRYYQMPDTAINQSEESVSCLYSTFRESSVIYEIALGLEYLHSLGIVHGDIKARNVLLSDDGHAQICDFGLTKTLDHRATSTELKGVGSIRWQSPELLYNHPKSSKSDVYALGLTISEVLSATYPFPHLNEQCSVIVAVILHNERPPFEPMSRLDVDFSPLWNLAARCWRTEPEKRPSMKDVLSELVALGLGH